MNPNRPSRNPQQMRSLIQNMGRSIDEARSRRLGPTAGPGASSNPADARGSSRLLGLDTRIGSDATPASSSPKAAASGASGSASSSPPPVRSANEMFSESTPRLKARPKRAS
jgi:hypothetical protein